MTSTTVTTRGRCLCGACSWEYRGPITDATICNCTACRRYGVLWAYDYVGEGIDVRGPEGGITAFKRSDSDGVLTFNFCNACGNLLSWQATRAGKDGRTRIAVNLRLAEPADVENIPLLRFDGLNSFEDLPVDGSTVKHVWF